MISSSRMFLGPETGIIQVLVSFLGWTWPMDRVVNGTDIEAAVLELALGGIGFADYYYTLDQ